MESLRILPDDDNDGLVDVSGQLKALEDGSLLDLTGHVKVAGLLDTCVEVLVSSLILHLLYYQISDSCARFFSICCYRSMVSQHADAAESLALANSSILVVSEMTGPRRNTVAAQTTSGRGTDITIRRTAATNLATSEDVSQNWSAS